MFEIKNLDQKFDYRSDFANAIFKLIFQKNNGDLLKCIADAKTMINHLDQCVRNIYELVENEIPMYFYYNLIVLGAGNYDLSEQEYIESSVQIRLGFGKRAGSTPALTTKELAENP